MSIHSPSIEGLKNENPIKIRRLRMKRLRNTVFVIVMVFISLGVVSVADFKIYPGTKIDEKRTKFPRRLNPVPFIPPDIASSLLIRAGAICSERLGGEPLGVL